MSIWEKEHAEEREIVQTRDTLRAEINGFEVSVQLPTQFDSTRLSIYPPRSKDVLRLGTIECRPRSVDDLEAFANAAEDLFNAIARELRSEGLSDLRCESDKLHDEIMNEY